MKEKDKEQLMQQMGDFAGIFAPPEDLTHAETLKEEPGTPEKKTTPGKPAASRSARGSRTHQSKGRTNKPLCIAIDEGIMSKIRVIMYRESSPTQRQTLKDIVDEALKGYIARYEARHGKIE